MPNQAAVPFVLADALLSAFDTNDRINQYLLQHLPAEAWRAEPPGNKGRDDEDRGRIRGFRPDVASFFGYLIAHDAHHRGQITMLARQAGHPIPQKVTFGMWEWGVR